MSTDYGKVRQAAEEALEYFEKVMAADGRRDRDTWKIRKGAPEWVREMVQRAHVWVGRDDYIYDFTYRALLSLLDCESLDEARDALRPDFGDGDLIAWLGSMGYRVSYVDSARAKFGFGDSVIDDIMRGQRLELRDVFDRVAAFLVERASR